MTVDGQYNSLLILCTNVMSTRNIHKYYNKHQTLNYMAMLCKMQANILKADVKCHVSFKDATMWGEWFAILTH